MEIEHPNAREVRNCLLQRLQPFRRKVYRNIGQSCQSSAGPSQAGNKPLDDRIGYERKYNWNCFGSFLRGQCRRAGCREDYVYVETGKFRGQSGKPIKLTLRVPTLDEDIFTLDITPPVGTRRVNLIGFPLWPRNLPVST